jgi:hypothetical protein
MFKRALKFGGALSLVAMAGAANADLIPIDAWQIDTANSTIGASLSTDIGHLNLSGGTATVEQEVNGSGNPFAGATFSEYGIIYSISYTHENSTGLGDSGAPGLFDSGLSLSLQFTGLSGTVASFDNTTGAIEYAFTPGAGSVNLVGEIGGSSEVLATFDVVSPSGGDLNNFFSIGNQTQGQSTISAVALTAVSDLFRFDDGTSMDDLIALQQIFGLVVTTNKISTEFKPSGACSFDAGAFCVSGVVTSDGSFDLLREVPVPGVLPLLGIGLFGLGFAFRTKES